MVVSKLSEISTGVQGDFLDQIRGCVAVTGVVVTYTADQAGIVVVERTERLVTTSHLALLCQSVLRPLACSLNHFLHIRLEARDANSSTEIPMNRRNSLP